MRAQRRQAVSWGWRHAERTRRHGSGAWQCGVKARRHSSWPLALLASTAPWRYRPPWPRSGRFHCVRGWRCRRLRRPLVRHTDRRRRRNHESDRCGRRWVRLVDRLIRSRRRRRRVRSGAGGNANSATVPKGTQKGVTGGSHGAVLALIPHRAYTGTDGGAGNPAISVPRRRAGGFASFSRGERARTRWLRCHRR